MTTTTPTIQRYLDALAHWVPCVTTARDGAAIALNMDLDARRRLARDPEDPDYDPSGDVEQDVREEISEALGDLAAAILVDARGVTVVPEEEMR